MLLPPLDASSLGSAEVFSMRVLAAAAAAAAAALTAAALELVKGPATL